MQWHRLSPEERAAAQAEPRARRTVAMPGGVGNVARNVAALGGQARLGAVAGQDAAGAELTDLIAAEGRVEDALVRPEGAATIVKTRFVAAGQQLLRLDDEQQTTSAYGDKSVFKGAKAILLSDYAKGVVDDGAIQAALWAGAEYGAPVIVDPKGRDFARYGAVDVIKPNASELAEQTEKTNTNEV